MATTADRTRHAGPQLGFQSLGDEVSVDRIPVEGSLPSWLAGSLLRNGPALYEAGAHTVNHWFDGQAMLHRFTIAHGEVSYANRFLQTKAYRAVRDGKIAFSEFATDPCRAIFKRVMTVFAPQVTDNTAVSLTRLGDQHHAMTEGPLSVQFDPRTLATLGYGKRVPGTFATAHPHHDPASGALVNVASRLGARSSYRFFVQEPGRRPRVLATAGVSKPGYVHSFAMSQRYLALTEFPFRVSPIEIPLSGRPFIENFKWDPERTTRILVFDRHTGAAVGTYETDPGFAFHHVGAWEEDGRLTMEYCDHGSAAIIDALYLDRLRSSPPPAPRREPARLRRVTIELTTGRVESEYRSNVDIELPRINEDARYLRRYRFAYGISGDGADGAAVAGRLVKVDNESGTSVVWSEAGAYPGEPIFVPGPGARAEDDGVLLSVVLDSVRGDSFLLVLDARTLDELARARAPHAIPFGFHGAFYAEG